ncbi:transposase [Cryobacterium serini]|nr:transposase [Cryobacterium serini]
MGNLTDPEIATALTVKKLAARYRFLEREILDTDAVMAEILRDCAPLLRKVPGVGIKVASQLLVTVGDDPERIASEAEFAARVGVAPIPASSGKTSRHKLSRGGDRAANAAVHHVVVSRLATDSRTREYAARRTAQGKTKKEIMRCLKRYVARELYRQLANHARRPRSPTYAPRAKTSTSPSAQRPDTSTPGRAPSPESNEDSAETTTSRANSGTGSTSKEPSKISTGDYRCVT